MIGFFRARTTFQVPAFLFLTFALKLVYIFHPYEDKQASPGGLLPIWLKTTVYPELNPTFCASLATVIFFFSALFANYLISSSRMFGKSNLLVALSMVLFTSLFPASNQLSATTILLPAEILLFQQIVKLYNNQKVRPVIINIGMLMGAGYLLYHPFIWLLPCCFFGMANMRAFRIREWLLLILGFITPLYFTMAYEFLTDQWAPKQHLLSWKFYKALPKADPVFWWCFTVAGFWVLAGIFAWQNQTRRMLIQSRKNWYQLIFIAAFILPMGLIPPGNFYEAIVLFAFPAGGIAANAFNGEKKLPATALFWLLIVTAALAAWKYVP